MFTRKHKITFLKLLSLFSVVRGYNILVIAIAQYFSSIFILGHHISSKKILLDSNLFIIVLASSTVIASGYIINNFYDREKDLINRPQKTMLDRLVSQQTKLSVYFVLNFLAVILASYVSFKAVLFFSMYIFGIWFYSHKLKKILFLGNVIAAVLSITPFLAVFIYYKNFGTVVFVHAAFLFLMLIMKELIKDLSNLKGDLTQSYKTIPIVYGDFMSKKIGTALTLFSIFPIYLLVFRYDVAAMNLYFYFSILLLILFLILLWKAKERIQYIWAHNILKIIIVSGVFSIILIDTTMILNFIQFMFDFIANI